MANILKQNALWKRILRWGNYPTYAGKRLLMEAKMSLGKDMGDSGYGDIVDCAVSVNNIVFKAFGDYAGGDISTYRMFHAIRNNKMFVEVSKPLPGDIILYPSGYGDRKIISNGHVGIVGEGSVVMSNSSSSGLWSANYTLQSMHQRYGIKGRYPVHYYRRVIV